MALTYLRLQGFIKQIMTHSKISNHLSGQTARLCFTPNAVQAVSSHTSVDQQLEADSSVNSEIKAADTDLKSGNEKSVYKKKLHSRILTGSEKEEEKKWKESKLGFQKSDSFGDMWKGKQRKIFDSNHHKSQRKIYKKKDKILLMKMAENNQSTKDEANTFGKMSDDRSLVHLLQDVKGQRFPDDESDANEGRTQIRLSKVGRFQEPYWYAKQINKLGKEGKILEAIDMLEETMLKRDRVMPTTYVFNQLLGILGNVGYTKKAFKLFNKMKKMGIHPDGHTYTCLFNCCSNSPWPSDGLQRTHKLHQLIHEKNVALHPITFKAMIKAYGVCGDIQAAFQTADEMCQLHRPDQQLYSFLLMACVSDTKMGLKHAIQVWRMMQKMKIKPDLPLYNLLLRVIRDSGFGGNEDIKKFPKSRNLQSKETTKEHQGPLPYPEEVETDKKLYIKTKSNFSQNTGAIEVKQSDVLDVVDLDANLFGDTPVSTSIDLRYPENRLAALGGPLAILQDMKKNGAKPNVLTFTQIIDSLPQENEAELQILEYMKVENIPRDIDLYNMIIRRRNRRDDYDAAREMLNDIAEEENIFPNLRTFGCLAMSCTTLSKAKNLLQNIDEAGLEPNIEIFGLLAYKSYLDFQYKEALLGMLTKRNIYPNIIFIKNVERSIQSARNKILKMERNETVGNYFKTEKFKRSFESFMINYSKWLQTTGLDKPEHPWKDFQHSKEEKGDQENVQC